MLLLDYFVNPTNKRHTNCNPGRKEDRSAMKDFGEELRLSELKSGPIFFFQPKRTKIKRVGEFGSLKFDLGSAQSSLKWFTFHSVGKSPLALRSPKLTSHLSIFWDKSPLASQTGH
ncbi:hypothetical protein V2J09_019521 [Rumex salicifolius]